MMTLQRTMPTTEEEELPACCWPAGRVETSEPQSHILTTHIKNVPPLLHSRRA